MEKITTLDFFGNDDFGLFDFLWSNLVTTSKSI